MLGPKGSNAAWDSLVRADYALQLVEDRADIDISGPEFNFVRSIRVFDVRYARQHASITVRYVFIMTAFYASYSCLY